MGVDVSTTAGFGVRVQGFPKDFNSEEQEEYEYLDEVLADTKYGYLEGGSYYTGKTHFYIVDPSVEDEIDKQNGFAFLEEVSKELEEFLKTKGFEYKGVPNIVCAELWH